MSEKNSSDSNSQKVKPGRGGRRKKEKWSKQSGQNICLCCDRLFTYKIDPLDNPRVQRRCNHCKINLKKAGLI